MLRKLNDLSVGECSLLIFLVGSLLPILGIIAWCVFNIVEGRSLETFDLAFMSHPVFTNLGASYLEMFIFNFIALIVIFLSTYLRYVYFADERDFMKKYNIKGKTGFGSDFKAPRSSGNDVYEHFDD